MGKRYLVRKAGNDLDGLLKRFYERKINPKIKQEMGAGRYFRETVLYVDKELKELYRDFSLIIEAGGSLKREFHRIQGYIELEAEYNFLSFMSRTEINHNEEHLEITDGIKKGLRLDRNPVPQGIPTERILIYQLQE